MIMILPTNNYCACSIEGIHESLNTVIEKIKITIRDPIPDGN